MGDWEGEGEGPEMGEAENYVIILGLGTQNPQCLRSLLFP